MTTSSIKTLFNAALNLEIVVGDKNHDDLLKEILAAGGAMGRTSLRNLLNGVRPSVCGFTVVEKKAAEPAAQIKKDEPTPALQPDLAPAPAAAPAPQDQPKADDSKPAPAPAVRPAAMNPWQQMMAQVDKSGAKVQAPEADAAASTGLKPVRRGTKIDLMLQALMTKGGVTFAELQKMLGWTEGAVSSYLHWEPQNKGYLVSRERGSDGALRYSLGFPKGVPNEILYIASAAAAPAAAKA